MKKLKINWRQNNVGFVLVFLLCTAKVFCGVIIDTKEKQDLVLYNKDDVFKYWLVKKFGEKQNDSGVFTKRISPLLASLKQSIPKTLFQMHLMQLKILDVHNKRYFAYRDENMKRNDFTFPLEIQFDTSVIGIHSITLHSYSNFS